MKLLLTLLLLTLVSCSPKTPVPALVFNTDYTVYESLVPNGQRVYLIHGSLKYSRAQWEHPVFKPFVDGLTAAGFEVITFDLPHFYIEYFNDGGLRYRTLFEKQMRTIVDKVNADRGQLPSIVGGFSFGGLHTLMAVAIMPDLFESYFAILPVIKMDALTELKGINSYHFNPKHEVAVLETKPGLISWGTRDYRVNFQHTVDLVNLMDPANLTPIEYPGLAHTSTPQVVNDTLVWVMGL